MLKPFKALLWSVSILFLLLTLQSLWLKTFCIILCKTVLIQTVHWSTKYSQYTVLGQAQLNLDLWATQAGSPTADSYGFDLYLNITFQPIESSIRQMYPAGSGYCAVVLAVSTFCLVSLLNMKLFCILHNCGEQKVSMEMAWGWMCDLTQETFSTWSCYYQQYPNSIWSCPG